jgi:hypothetical protein
VVSASLVDGVTSYIVLAAIRWVGIRACIRGVTFDAGDVLMGLALLAGWREIRLFRGCASEVILNFFNGRVHVTVCVPE